MDERIAIVLPVLSPTLDQGVGSLQGDIDFLHDGLPVTTLVVAVATDT